MKLSQRLRDEAEFVDRHFGDFCICSRCGVTLKTYAEDCGADLQEPCPGFLAIERAKEQFKEAAAIRARGSANDS